MDLAAFSAAGFDAKAFINQACSSAAADEPLDRWGWWGDKGGRCTHLRTIHSEHAAPLSHHTGTWRSWR